MESCRRNTFVLHFWQTNGLQIRHTKHVLLSTNVATKHVSFSSSELKVSELTQVYEHFYKWLDSFCIGLSATNALFLQWFFCYQSTFRIGFSATNVLFLQWFFCYQSTLLHWFFCYQGTHWIGFSATNTLFLQCYFCYQSISIYNIGSIHILTVNAGTRIGSANFKYNTKAFIALRDF